MMDESSSGRVGGDETKVGSGWGGSVARKGNINRNTRLKRQGRVAEGGRDVWGRERR